MKLLSSLYVLSQWGIHHGPLPIMSLGPREIDEIQSGRQSRPDHGDCYMMWEVEKCSVAAPASYCKVYVRHKHYPCNMAHYQGFFPFDSFIDIISYNWDLTFYLVMIHAPRGLNHPLVLSFVLRPPCLPDLRANVTKASTAYIWVSDLLICFVSIHVHAPANET